MIVVRLKEEYERQGKGPNSRNRANVLERGDAGNVSYIRYNNASDSTGNNNTQDTSSSSAPQIVQSQKYKINVQMYIVYFGNLYSNVPLMEET